MLLATGGFAGDTGPASLMAKWAPQLLQVPTTSDERTNGDGISLSGAVKAATQQLAASGRGSKGVIYNKDIHACVHPNVLIPIYIYYI